jgi:hypothetical protein
MPWIKVVNWEVDATFFMVMSIFAEVKVLMLIIILVHVKF